MTDLSVSGSKRIIRLLEKISLAALTFTMVLNYTLAGLLFRNLMLVSEALFGGFLVLASVIEFFWLDSVGKKAWLKGQIVILLYFAVRAVCFVHVRSFSSARSLFLEGIYLLALTRLTVDRKTVTKVILPGYMILSLACNTTLLIVMDYFRQVREGRLHYEGYRFLVEDTYYPIHGELGVVYSNPNTMGIMTAFAILIALVYAYRARSRILKTVLMVFAVFSLVCLRFADCRSAEAGLAVCLLIGVILMLVKKLKGRPAVICVFLCCVIAVSALAAYMGTHADTGVTDPSRYTAIERRIEGLGTHRYTLWKSGLLAGDGTRLLGAGSMKLATEQREEYREKAFVEAGGKASYYHREELDPHSGYFGMLFATGLPCAILFFLHILLKLIRTRTLEEKEWAIPLIFAFVANLFETMSVITRYYICILTILLIAMGFDRDGRGEVKR